MLLQLSWGGCKAVSVLGLCSLRLPLLLPPIRPRLLPHPRRLALLLALGTFWVFPSSTCTAIPKSEQCLMGLGPLLFSIICSFLQFLQGVLVHLDPLSAATEV